MEKIAQRETYKEKFDRGDAEDGGQEKQQEKEEKESDKVIFVHYEQRKVMLSQLHPSEAPDPGTQSPSELRQVGDSAVTRRQLAVETQRDVLPALSVSAKPPGVPHSGPQPATLLPGQVRRRAAEVDALAVGGSRGQHHHGAAQTGVGATVSAHQLAALHLDVDLRPVVRRGRRRRRMQNHLKTFRVALDDHTASSASLQGHQPAARALLVEQAVHLRPAELQDRPHEGAQLSEVR